MSRPLLLDTHAAVRIALDQTISPAARTALEEARRTDRDMFVSPISAWEIATLVQRRRLVLHMDPAAWFSALLKLPGVRLAGMPPEVLIAAVQLPGVSAPKDPADRIILATARAYGLRLVTRDSEMLDYAEEGLVVAVEC